MVEGKYNSVYKKDNIRQVRRTLKMTQKEFLEYFNEYNLNTKPLQIDLLIIKKLCKTELRNEIGKENQIWLTVLNSD